MVMSPCHVYVKPIDSSYDFVGLKSVLKTLYVFKRETPLRISASFEIPSADRRRGSSASVQIRCSPDIKTEQNVVIQGAETTLNPNRSEFRLFRNGISRIKGLCHSTDSVLVMAVEL